MELKDLTDTDAVICTSREEYDLFSQLLHDNGFKWSSGALYTNTKYWEESLIYEGGIGINVAQGAWARANYYIKEVKSYNKIPASHFLNQECSYEIY